MSRDSFIARWSRLKGEAAAQPPEAASIEAPSPPDAGAAPISAEEIAALPPVDALTPLSDIAPFLRRGVPALLRNAALRRMWSLNPSIRDYVDDAREYAMDWNTPGAILGNGPLGAGDDAAAMARRVIGEVGKAADALAGDPSPQEETAADAQRLVEAPPAEPPLAEPAPSSAPTQAAEGAPQPARRAPAPAPRRHGGATPT